MRPRNRSLGIRRLREFRLERSLTDCRASSDMSSASRVTHTGSIVLEGQIGFVVLRSHDMILISMSASGIAVRPWEPTQHTALIASAAASVPTFLGAILWSSFARAAVRVHVDADVCASFPRVPAMHFCGESCHKKGSSTVLGGVRFRIGFRSCRFRIGVRWCLGLSRPLWASLGLCVRKVWDFNHDSWPAEPFQFVFLMLIGPFAQHLFLNLLND